MRDILLTLVIGALLPAILARPSIGAYAWAWISLMNPHRLAWGFAQTVPFAQIIAITTLLRTLFSTKRNRPQHAGGDRRAMGVRDEDPYHDVPDAGIAARQEADRNIDLGRDTLARVLRSQGWCVHHPHRR